MVLFIVATLLTWWLSPVVNGFVIYVFSCSCLVKLTLWKDTVNDCVYTTSSVTYAICLACQNNYRIVKTLAVKKFDEIVLLKYWQNFG